jgi:hypothetical protein
MDVKAKPYPARLLRVLVLLLLLGLRQAAAQESSAAPQTPKKEFEDRAQTLLAYFVEKETKPSFAAVAARYAAGERIGEAQRMMGDLLFAFNHEAVYAFRLMATYLYGRQNLPPALAEKTKAAMGKIAFDRGASEHENVLYFTAILLAAETWPEMEAEQWFNGKSSSENLREAKGFLHDWLAALVTQGQYEFDAPQFMPHFFAALALTHEFTRDDDLRKKLKVALHVIMIDFAAEHMAGVYAGAHSRNAQAFELSPREAPSNGFAWLYFGAGRMIPSAELLFASLSSYELPEIVAQLATKRDPIGGIVHRERKRRQPCVREQDQAGAGFCKYAYVTRQYTLGSIPGGALSAKDQRSWSLAYRSKQDQHPVLFLASPSFTERELGRYHSAEPRLLLAEMKTRVQEAGTNAVFRGATEHERIFQHRNVLIGLYDTPDSLDTIRLHGFFSQGLDTLLFADSTHGAAHPDWVFGKAAETFFALLPLQPYRFENFPEGRLLVSQGARNGFILEVSTATESGSLAEFQRRIREVTHVDLSRFAPQTRVKYATTYGDQMDFSFNAATGKVERFLNDAPVTTTDCPLFDSPMLKHYPEAKRMTLRFKNEWLELDFDKWEVTENISTITEELKQQ